MDNEILTKLLEISEEKFSEGEYLEISKLLKKAYIINNLIIKENGEFIKFPKPIDVYLYEDEGDLRNDYIINFSIIGFNSTNHSLITIEIENKEIKIDINITNTLNEIFFDFLPKKIKILIEDFCIREYYFSRFTSMYKMCLENDVSDMLPTEVYDLFTDYIENCIKHKIKEIKKQIYEEISDS